MRPPLCPDNSTHRLIWKEVELVSARIVAIQRGCDASILKTTALGTVSFGSGSEVVLGWREQHSRLDSKGQLTVLGKQVVDDWEDQDERMREQVMTKQPLSRQIPNDGKWGCRCSRVIVTRPLHY
jgi:hypothetical protein